MDTKNIFKDGLAVMQTNMERLFYTTTMPFVRDLASAFSAGLVEAAPVELGVPIMGSSKKVSIDFKERKRIAKRIIKAVQPALVEAVRAEADICKKSVEEQIKELEMILETGTEPCQSVTAPPSIEQNDMEVDLNVDLAVNLELLDASPSKTAVRLPGPQDEPGTNISMTDYVLVAHEHATVEVSASTPHIVVNGDESSSVHSTNVNTASTPPPANGASSQAHPNGGRSTPRSTQPAPPTPPISNGESSSAVDCPADILLNGGVPWHVRDFQPDGTRVLQEDPFEPLPVGKVDDDITMDDVTATAAAADDDDSDELSDMDDEELLDLGAEFAEKYPIAQAASIVVDAKSSTAAPPVTGAKKKSKKRRKNW